MLALCRLLIGLGSAAPCPPAVPAPRPLRIGAAAGSLPVPALAADRAGAIRRSSRVGAETVVVLVQGRRPG